MDLKTKQNGTYPWLRSSTMGTLPLQFLQISIVARYLNLYNNIWKKIFENFRHKKFNFFKYWVISNFGPFDFYSGLIDRKMQQNEIYLRHGVISTRTLLLKLIQICIVARYLNHSNNILKKTFENFRPKNPTFSNAD